MIIIIIINVIITSIDINSDSFDNYSGRSNSNRSGCSNTNNRGVPHKEMGLPNGGHKPSGTRLKSFKHDRHAHLSHNENSPLLLSPYLFFLKFLSVRHVTFNLIVKFLTCVLFHVTLSFRISATLRCTKPCNASTHDFSKSRKSSGINTLATMAVLILHSMRNPRLRVEEKEQDECTDFLGIPRGSNGRWEFTLIQYLIFVIN